MKLKILAMVAAVASLQACVFAPGQQMSHSQISRGTKGGARYQLVPITPKLIETELDSGQAATIPPELLNYQPESYRIGAGDSLYITVWEHPELTSPAGEQQQTAANGRLVRPDGTLFYPYVGVLHAAGMTVEELRSTISQRLSKFIEKPQVDISLVGYGSQRIAFEGAFNNPAPQSLTVLPLTLEQAIGTAGVDPARADLSDLVLSRDGHDYHLNVNALSEHGDGVKDVYLRGGDRVFLPYNDQHEVYVVGEVVRPTAVSFKMNDMNLAQALGRAGGLQEDSARGKAVYVIRGVEDMDKAPATIYQIDASSPSALALASQFTVHPSDVVFVGAAGITRWNRFISQLLPLSSVINNASTSRYNFDRADQ